VRAISRRPDTAAAVSNAAGSGTSAACQNHIVENLRTAPVEVPQARVQPKTKTFSPSSYFPKSSKSVTLR
jgi:hypothetical protein